jgi:hypothetical protein
MKPRQLPGALALGFLASIVAHASSFGESHVMGGSYHDLFVDAAIAVGGGLLTLCASLAWTSAGRTRDGSVVATTLRQRLPSLPALVLSTAAWLWCIERSEPTHAPANPLLLATAVALASLLIMLASRTLLRVLAAIVLAVRVRRLRAKRSPCTTPFFSEPHAARAVAFSYRRFARPPPVATLRA